MESESADGLSRRRFLQVSAGAALAQSRPDLITGIGASAARVSPPDSAAKTVEAVASSETILPQDVVAYIGTIMSDRGIRHQPSSPDYKTAYLSLNVPGGHTIDLAHHLWDYDGQVYPSAHISLNQHADTSSSISLYVNNYEVEVDGLRFEPPIPDIDNDSDAFWEAMEEDYGKGLEDAELLQFGGNDCVSTIRHALEFTEHGIESRQWSKRIDPWFDGIDEFKASFVRAVESGELSFDGVGKSEELTEVRPPSSLPKLPRFGSVYSRANLLHTLGRLATGTLVPNLTRPQGNFALSEGDRFTYIDTTEPILTEEALQLAELPSGLDPNETDDSS